MKAVLILCLILSSAFAAEQANRVIPSSRKDRLVHYVWIADDPAGDAYIHNAILQRGQELPWSFSARGRAMVFSWSPDARYLLVGLVKPGKDMSLYYIDANAGQPKEQNLDLESVEKQVSTSLPEREPDRGESVAFASHHQVDFERVEWTSSHECRLHYISQFDRKAGEAVLTLDLSAHPPALKIGKIIPRGPQ